MTAIAARARPADAGIDVPAAVGPLGRLGRWAADNVRTVALAVLLDAMLVRLVLIPTLLRVFGRWAWARPRWLDRILPDVRFGHS